MVVLHFFASLLGVMIFVMPIMYPVDEVKDHYRQECLPLAQWQSIWLLTRGSFVRIEEGEPNMSKKTPEEIAALKAKYGDQSAEKEAAKAAKKAKFAEQNADRNMPVCEIRVPKRWVDELSNGSIAWKEIDLDLSQWLDYLDRLEWHWRTNFAYTQRGYEPDKIYLGPCKRKIVRT